MLLLIERIVTLLQACLRLALGSVQQALDLLQRSTRFPLVGGLFGPGFLGIGFWVFIVHVWPIYYLRTSGGLELQDQLREADRIHFTPALYDAKGEFVSALDFSAYGTGGSVAASQQYFGRVDKQGKGLERLASTVFVEQPNADFVACLRLLEDGWDQHPVISPYGVDLLFPARTVKSLNLTGGSSLVAQYQQQIGFRKLPSPWYVTAERKFEEILFRTPAMAAVVGYNQNNSAQFAARVMPHVTGAGGEGGMLRGLSMASRVMFGVDADRITQAQAYFLAGSINPPPKLLYHLVKGSPDPVAWTFAGNKSAEARQKDWAKAVGPVRAGKCVDELAQPNQRESLLRDLQAIAVGDKAAKPSPLAERLGLDYFAQEPDPAAAWGRAAQNPFRHAGALLPNVVDGVAAELRDAFDNRWNGAVNRLTLTLELEPQYAFQKAFDQQVRSWLRNTDAEGLLNPIYRDWANGGDCSPKPANPPAPLQSCPSIVAAIADADGRIVRYYSSQTNLTPYYGSFQAGRPEEEGSPIRSGYRWDRETLQVASIGKVGAAILFARLKVDPRGLADMMARSSTDQVSAALSVALGDARRKARLAGQPVPEYADEVANLLHWSSISVVGPSGGDDGRAAAYSKGTYAASPRTIHHNMSVLLNGFMGRPGLVRVPTLIRQVGYLDYYHRKLGPIESRLPDYLADHYGAIETGTPRKYLRNLRDPARRAEVSQHIRAALASPHSGTDPDTLVPPEDRPTVYALLNAPFCAKKGGTLGAVGAVWCQRARLLFGKTGTHDITNHYRNLQRADRLPVPPTTKGVVNTLWAVGGLQLQDSRGYSFVLLVSGGSSLQTPLFVPQRAGARDIEASSLSRLLQLMLRDISGSSATGQVTGGQGNGL